LFDEIKVEEPIVAEEAEEIKIEEAPIVVEEVKEEIKVEEAPILKADCRSKAAGTIRPTSRPTSHGPPGGVFVLS